MKKVKVIFYLKDTPKPVVLSEIDGATTIHEIREKIQELMSSDKVYEFETDTDIFIARPCDIKGVLINKQETVIQPTE